MQQKQFKYQYLFEILNLYYFNKTVKLIDVLNHIESKYKFTLKASTANYYLTGLYNFKYIKEQPTIYITDNFEITLIEQIPENLKVSYFDKYVDNNQIIKFKNKLKLENRQYKIINIIDKTIQNKHIKTLKDLQHKLSTEEYKDVLKIVDYIKENINIL